MVTKRKRFTYEQSIHNRKAAHSANEKALQAARERMEREGIKYPEYNPRENAAVYLDALKAYGELESKYMIEALRMPSGDRPIIEYE